MKFIKSKSTFAFMKWFLIVLIGMSISFLVLTYLKSTGFTFFDRWKTSSVSDTILGGPGGELGPGPMQKHVLQILVTVLGGGALGVAGALLQKVTKNRLAEVSILGIGSLNILFIYIYVMALKGSAFGGTIWAYMMPVFLIIVSVVGTLFVWAISRSRKANKNTFVIVGIALQLLIEGISVVVVNPTKLNSTTSSGGRASEGKRIWHKIQGYTLGDVRNDIGNETANYVPWWLIYLAAAVIVIVIVTIFFMRKKIDTFETSEELAISTGINVKKTRLVMYILVALLAGVSSAILGTVALLGIIAPSIARLLFKNKMFPLTIASFLIGGFMVEIASFVSLNWGFGIPVGILSTAIVIPYFIYLMIREK